jgi:hypothetical protein
MTPEERAFIERHAEADIIYDTKTGRVVRAVYPEWHPWGRVQRFLWEVASEPVAPQGVE